MKSRALFLSTITVLSLMVAGIATPAIGQSAPSQEMATAPHDAVADSTQRAADDGGSENGDSDGPQAREIRPDELGNVTLDRDSVPQEIVGPNVRTMKDEPQVGTTKYFPSLNYKTGQYYLKTYTLRGYSENGAVWVANNLSFPKDDPRSNPNITDAQVEYLIQEFETNIHPTGTELFGSPDPQYGTNASLSGPPGANGTVPDGYYQSPDNKSRTVILVDNVRDNNYYNESYPVYTAGFYSSSIDSFTDRNVLTMDSHDWANRLGPNNSSWRPENASGQPFGIDSTLVHEYQHLIQSDHDPDEKSWINEGLSVYSERAAGYGMSEGHVQAFEENPENSLVEWGDQGDINILADYGAAGLFQLYLSQQYGDSFIKNLARDPDNGINGVTNTLNEASADRDFYSLYQDFSTALVVDGIEDPIRPPPDRHQFENFTVDVNTTSTDNTTAAWGSSYNTLRGDGPMMEFTANGTDFKSTAWQSVSAPGDSNDSVLWSNTGNLKDNNAVMEVDLTETDSPELTFETYYDIEQGWDYGFVQISTDGGETWQSLSNANTTSQLASPDSAYPPIAENRPGFTGDTGGKWVTESFDLSEYKGQEVLISFRSMSDWASQGNSSEIPGTGWYLRNINVSETNVSHDGSSVEPFESLSEVREQYVNYQFTFIAVSDNGLYRVVQLDAKQFENGTPQELRKFIRSPVYDRIIFTSTWAARPGETGSVPYGFDPVYLDEFLEDLGSTA